VLEYKTEITYLPVGILNENFNYKSIIFPDLLKLIDQETTDGDILLLLLDYFNANELNPSDFNEYLPQLISLSEKYRKIITSRASLGVDIWDDSDYQNARYKAGIIADLLGHFNNENVKVELGKYLSLSDNKLIMFAALSLLKQGKDISPEIAEKIAADSECRKWFYSNLTSLNRTSIYPEKYRTQEAFAESDMVNWLIYPTELARTPDSIELMEIIEVDSKSSDGIVEFYLFRFKSDHDNWKEDGWMSAISGYFLKSKKPSTEAYGYTFSTFEKWDSKTPEEHVRDIKSLIEGAYKNK
jgi:hypothetical protein